MLINSPGVLHCFCACCVRIFEAYLVFYWRATVR